MSTRGQHRSHHHAGHMTPLTAGPVPPPSVEPIHKHRDAIRTWPSHLGPKPERLAGFCWDWNPQPSTQSAMPASAGTRTLNHRPKPERHAGVCWDSNPQPSTQSATPASAGTRTLNKPAETLSNVLLPPLCCNCCGSCWCRSRAASSRVSYICSVLVTVH